MVLDIEGAAIVAFIIFELMLFITTSVEFIKDIWYGDEDEI